VVKGLKYRENVGIAGGTQDTCKRGVCGQHALGAGTAPVHASLGGTCMHKLMHECMLQVDVTIDKGADSKQNEL
jgi:hypothetical protein